ncbi:MAG: CinA family protein [Betaproteobacteria bacterium]
MSAADLGAAAYDLADRLGRVALARGIMLAAAESCTGGMVAGALTAVPGSSQWFERGFVTYSNEAKAEMLGVSLATLERGGAVSVETASEMAVGALQGSRADWSVAVTGVAGPDGGTAQKPVGTVCFAWAGPAGLTTERTLLGGSRAEVREESVRRALQGLLDRLA